MSRVRPRYVVTLPKSLRRRGKVEVGDNMVWLRLSEKEFLAVVLPQDRYRALADLMGDIQLTPEAKLAAQSLYFKSAGSKAGR